MSSTYSLAPLHKEALFPWQQYLLDSVLALLGVMGVTGIIFAFHLYPRIPNISIVYLLVVLPLSVTRGRYSAMLAAVLAFLSFDFFLVPPLYTFVIYHVEEWIALFIFLIDALLTGQLASTLRQRAEETARRERETRTLYHLVRATNSAEEPEAQLQAISQQIVAAFASWGVQACALLQPDAAEEAQANTSYDLSSTKGQVTLSDVRTPHSQIARENRLLASSSVRTRRSFLPGKRSVEARTLQHSLHLLPLKLGQKVVGVLRLDVLGDASALRREEALKETHASAEGPSSFFWTFLDQVATLLERARLQQENLRLAIVQRTDALRAALLSSVSHDLRTPLTAIKAAASTLLQEDVQWSREAQRSFLQSIEREADRLNRLVANLLDMSRIEEGALKPDKDWYSLKALLQDVLGRLAPFFEGRDVRLRLPDDLLLVEFDYLQMDQVLTNLLENALRYTPAGSPIEISAQIEEKEVVVSVADRGPGLSPMHLSHVFDKFYRVLHGPTTPSTATGSGLGLAVCKGLIEAHGGHIWAEAREGGGLLVSFTLPVGEPERKPV